MNSLSLPPDPQATAGAATPTHALAPRGRPAAFLLFRLALADLWHERMLTLCVIVALTAVLAPLLILQSLKYGLVETLRTRLIEDPRNREVRPQTSQLFTTADIDALRQRQDVSFIIPLLSSFSTNVRVSLDPHSRGTDAELIPTQDNDPILVENDAPVPTLGQCALSHSLYHRLSEGKGNIRQVHLHLTRRGPSGQEDASVTLEVTGAISERAAAKESVFVQFQLLQEIENYLQGLPVPRLGWTGQVQQLSPVVEDVLFTLPRELDTLERQNLTTNTAFTRLATLSREEFAHFAQENVPDGHHIYHLSIGEESHHRPATQEDIIRLRNTLPTTAGDLHGLCRQLDTVTLTYSDGRPLRTTGVLGIATVVSHAIKRPAPKTAPPAPPPAEDVTVQKALPVPMAPEVPPAPEKGQKTEKAPQITPPQPIVIVPPSGNPAPVATPAPVTPTFRFEGTVIIPSRSIAPPIQRSKSSNKAKPSSKPGNDSPPPSGSDRKRSDKAPTGLIRPPPPGARYILAALPPAEIALETAPKAAPKPAAKSAAKPANQESSRIIYLPASWDVPTGETIQLSLESAGGPLQISAIVKTHPAQSAALPQSLAGVLRAAQDTPARFDPQLQAIIPTHAAWPSFRLVARDIDSVQPLVDHFHDLGINVITKAERIRDVKELDTYTTHVFTLVAAVGLTGAVGALLASLFAAVERKRRSLGVMRLLGMRRRALLRLPFYQSALIVTASVGLSILAWHWVSKAIIRFTQRYLEAGESLQTLPHSHLALFWGAALALAALAALIAGIRVMRVDPGEAIRDE
jgi:hypothetical protein